MSFGGSVSAMITSIKNNQRKPKPTFKKSVSTLRSSAPLKFKKKASPQQLHTIRKQLQKENKRELVLGFVACSCFVLLICYLINTIH
ncbi:conserved hypothetical protein [Tenacibaculum litopenaei]|uniref:hypothetical protein n=1 Tax=Tenacibaculum litopenaei TaxID=396016 RepID=UPI003893B092